MKKWNKLGDLDFDLQESSIILDEDPLAPVEQLGTEGYMEEQELLDMLLQQRIFSKQGELVQFKPFPPQEKILDYVCECLRKQAPIRLIICKARQLGCSTLIEAIIFCLVSTLVSRMGLVAAHNVKASQTVFDTCQVLYDNATDPKPLSHRSQRGLAFAAPHYSRIQIDTANNRHLGRSGRVNYAHITELAMWERPKSPMAALYQCIPNTADTMMVQESTALGPGDYFHSQFRAASEKLIETEAMFLDWKDFPHYSLPPIKNVRKKANEDERAYIEEFNLSDEQATWYLHTLREQCARDQETFDREFPMTAERAFSATGEGWFDMKAIQLMMRPRKKGGYFFEPRFIGDAVWDGKESKKKKNIVSLEKNPQGKLRIWEYPEKGRIYVICCDVCEGRKQDWHVQQVWALPKNVDELPELVAKWKDYSLDALEAGDVAWRLGLYYNTALLVVERNGPGTSMIDFLKHAEGPLATKGLFTNRTGYPNIYRDPGPLAQARKQLKTALGFRTLGTNKRAMLEQAQRLIAQLRVIIHSKDTLEELIGFQWSYDKQDWVQRYENILTGNPNDDEVIALALFAMVYHRWGNKRFFSKFKETL